MSYDGIVISFSCRLCTNSFKQIDDFIAHKKEHHFQEFQQMTCIVFEDKLSPINSSYNRVQHSSPPSAIVKLETFDDDSLSFEPEPQSESEPEGCISMQPLFEVIPNKVETFEDDTTFGHEILPQLPLSLSLYENPFVLPKRLSRKEIQNSTEDHSSQTQKYNDLTTKHRSNANDSEEVPHPSTNGDDTTKFTNEYFSSKPQLRTHVQICLLYKNNKAYSAHCTKCNNFFRNPQELQDHIKYFHVQNQNQKVISEQTKPTTTTPALHSVQKKSEEKSDLITVPISSTDTDSKQNSHRTKYFLNLDRLQDQDQASVHVEVDNDSNYAKFLEPVHPTFGNLEQNINIIDSTRFTCSYPNCQITFKTKATLQRHSTRHTNFKPLKCSFPDCQLTFRHNWELEQHFWRHTGLKPFKCPVPGCDKAFTNRGTMYNHKLTHADTSSFKCPHPSCKQAFKAKRGLRKHLKAVHSGSGSGSIYVERKA